MSKSFILQKDISAILNVLNGGKKSLSVNLKHSEGVKIIDKLAGNCDILLEPFRPGKNNKYI